MAGERYCMCGHLQSDHEGAGQKLNGSACTLDGCGCAKFEADDTPELPGLNIQSSAGSAGGKGTA